MNQRFEILTVNFFASDGSSKNNHLILSLLQRFYLRRLSHVGKHGSGENLICKSLREFFENLRVHLHRSNRSIRNRCQALCEPLLKWKHPERAPPRWTKGIEFVKNCN